MGIVRVKKPILRMTALILILSLAGCSGAVKPVSSEVYSPASEPVLNTGKAAPASSPMPTPQSTPTPVPVKMTEYTGVVHHIFFHALIAFPEIAYSGSVKGALDTDCVTVTEFKRCLEELYKNNYVLIDINSTFEIVKENGRETVKSKKLMVPEGKKPLVMSVDDMVYDPKKRGWGMVDKIILDDKGNFATYTKYANGQEVISYDNEIIPILDQFVRQHPDFSLNGAKATLALTGWVGILGYRIDHESPDREKEIEAVKPIVARLKETGWNFASHGYGHRHSSKISYGLLADDTKKWKDEIGSVIGATPIYVYPYGDALRINDPKYKLLMDNGFKVFCGVDAKPGWKDYTHSISMARQAIDGYSLRNYRNYLKPLFDTTKVIDLQIRGK